MAWETLVVADDDDPCLSKSVFIASEASKQQHRNIFHHPSRASAQGALRTTFSGVSRVIYTPHTWEPLKELCLDTKSSSLL
mmetsp:Transcript_15396/g.41658  ORF Transcript_15396/g.41658 Transcript_15396/m.41658 type:complete len:81 (+) Transcript_15396:1954-2196(+)